MADRLTERSRRMAADFVSRLPGRGMGADELARLEQWRQATPENEKAYIRAKVTWDDAEDLKQHLDVRTLMGPPALRTRVVRILRNISRADWVAMPRPALGLAVSVCLLLVIGLTMILRPTQSALAIATAVAETRQLRLDDGSIVTLGPKTILSVRFTDRERRVELSPGEAFFAVTKNPSRPFYVVTAGTLVRVTGTKFNVNSASGTVRVAVAEGSVEVRRRRTLFQMLAQPVVLNAGQQTTVMPDTDPSRASRIVGASPGSWRDGRLTYDDAPLSQIIADANRYRRSQIRLGSEKLAGVRFTTSFRPSDIDETLVTLGDALGLQARLQPDGTTLLTSANGSGGQQ